MVWIFSHRKYLINAIALLLLLFSYLLYIFFNSQLLKPKLVRRNYESACIVSKMDFSNILFLSKKIYLSKFNECCKIKTKLITLANQTSHRQSIEPIKTQSKIHVAA